MQKETQVIRWVEHKEEKVPECRNNRSHSDPTANEAIGNVMREERRKEKLLKEQLPQKHGLTMERSSTSVPNLPSISSARLRNSKRI